MDRDNFDIDRVSSCGDLVPNEEGLMILPVRITCFTAEKTSASGRGCMIRLLLKKCVRYRHHGDIDAVICEHPG